MAGKVGKKLGKRPSWMAATEQATLRRQPESVVAAKKVFREELSFDQQMAAAGEIVETRAAEICRAYKSVVDLSHGLRLKRDAKTGAERVGRVPCVIFMVKKKWASKDDGPEVQCLPEHLFTYWSIKGKRKLCAIPTDIQEAGQLGKVRPQARSGKIITRGGTRRSKNAVGVIAGSLRRSMKPGKVYALSCRHVFSISKRLPPSASRELPVSRRDNGSIFARTTGVRGILHDDFQYSLDAQLALVSNRTDLAAVLGGLNLVGFAKKASDLPRSYWIIQPGGAVKAKFLSWERNRQIKYPGVGDVIHRILVRSRVAGSTLSGDSGSPVVVGKNGGRFLGMHIAGEGSTSMMVPAWELMRPDRYLGRKIPGDRWTLL